MRSHGRITDRFLKAQDEEWMVSFYAFLNGQEALWRPQGVSRNPPEGPLRKKAIIRCQDGRHRAPFDSAGETPCLSSDRIKGRLSCGRQIHLRARRSSGVS